MSALGQAEKLGNEHNMSPGLSPCVDGSELARTFFTFAALVGAPVRPLDAVSHKTAGHNALADQAPVKSPHSTMRWHLWVVLIAGSTGSGLRAVRPPNLHIKPDRAPPSFLSPSPEIVRKVDDWPLVHADGSDPSVGSCERRSHIDTSD